MLVYTYWCENDVLMEQPKQLTADNEQKHLSLVPVYFKKVNTWACFFFLKSGASEAPLCTWNFLDYVAKTEEHSNRAPFNYEQVLTG